MACREILNLSWFFFGTRRMSNIFINASSFHFWQLRGVLSFVVIVLYEILKCSLTTLVPRLYPGQSPRWQLWILCKLSRFPNHKLQKWVSSLSGCVIAKPGRTAKLNNIKTLYVCSALCCLLPVSCEITNTLML